MVSFFFHLGNDIDAVSGATVSLYALSKTIKATAQTFSTRKLFMRNDYSCKGCVRGMAGFEPECFICGGIKTNSEKERCGCAGSVMLIIVAIFL